MEERIISMIEKIGDTCLKEENTKSGSKKSGSRT